MRVSRRNESLRPMSSLATVAKDADDVIQDGGRC